MDTFCTQLRARLFYFFIMMLLGLLVFCAKWTHHHLCEVKAPKVSLKERNEEKKAKKEKETTRWESSFIRRSLWWVASYPCRFYVRFPFHSLSFSLLLWSFGSFCMRRVCLDCHWSETCYKIPSHDDGMETSKAL